MLFSAAQKVHLSVGRGLFVYRNIKLNLGIHNFKYGRKIFLGTEMSICHMICNMFLSDTTCYTCLVPFKFFVESGILKKRLRLKYVGGKKKLLQCTGEKFLSVAVGRSLITASARLAAASATSPLFPFLPRPTITAVWARNLEYVLLNGKTLSTLFLTE